MLIRLRQGKLSEAEGAPELWVDWVTWLGRTRAWLVARTRLGRALQAGSPGRSSGLGREPCWATWHHVEGAGLAGCTTRRWRRGRLGLSRATASWRAHDSTLLPADQLDHRQELVRRRSHWCEVLRRRPDLAENRQVVQERKEGKEGSRKNEKRERESVFKKINFLKLLSIICLLKPLLNFRDVLNTRISYLQDFES